MRVEDDPEMRTEMLYRIKRKYDLFANHREGLHHSDLTYCITRTFWKNKYPTSPTDHEALLFAVGLGLEEVLLEDNDVDNRPPPVELDGVIVSPDHVVAFAKGLAELKSTRIYMPKNELSPAKGWPEGWIKQMMGYKYVESKHPVEWRGLIEPSDFYRIASYHVIAAELHGRRFIFEQSELDAHWSDIIFRKNALEAAYKANLPPQPYAYVTSESRTDWQCTNCPFQMHCATHYSAGRFVPKEV